MSEAKARPYEKPVYKHHTDIPAGTGVFKSTVLQIYAGSAPALHRDLKNGRFPKPVYFIGTRPVWNIDDIRAFARGEWKPEGKAVSA